MSSDRDALPGGVPDFEELVSPFGGRRHARNAPFASYRTPDAFLPLPWSAPSPGGERDEGERDEGGLAGEYAEGAALLDESPWRDEGGEADERYDEAASESLDDAAYETDHELHLETDYESRYEAEPSAFAEEGWTRSVESGEEYGEEETEDGFAAAWELADEYASEFLADEAQELGEVPWSETELRAESEVIDERQRVTWTPVVDAAIIGGNRDANKLTNIVFHARNPTLGGRAIAPHEKALAREWIAVRDVIVRPALERFANIPVVPTAPSSAGAQAAGPPRTDLRPLAGRLDAARRALGEGAGELRMKVGRVARPWFRLRSAASPDPKLEIRKLLLNDVVFIERELRRPGETLSWYYVFVAPPESGSGPTAGWIRSDGVALDPPEPGATVHYIESERETLIDIAARYYKPQDGFSWGDDARFYVAALAYANRDRAAIIFPLGWTDADFQRRSGWKDIHIKRGHTLWIPSREFMKTLQTKVSSGSITYELWKTVKRLARKVWDWIVYAAAFVAGLVHGAMEAVYDVFADAAALIKTLWNVLRELFTGDIIGQAKKLWNAIKELDVKAMASQLAKDFATKWMAEDPWDRGYFRGHVAGYILAEIAMAIFTVGFATAVKWLGKASKFAKVAVQLASKADFLSIGRRAEKVANKVPDDVNRRLRPHFDPNRTPGAPEPPRRPPAPTTPEPPQLQRMRGRIPDADLTPVRLLPADVWSRIVQKARQNLAAYRQGGARRAGAIHSVKGTLLESLVVRMPIHREMMDWARENARRLGFDPDSVRFTMQVDDVIDGRPRQALTDGIVYARHGDKTVVMAVFESKAQNFRLLAKEPESVAGQVERSLARFESGAVRIDGVRVEPSQLRVMADYGERTRWAGIVPRDTLSATQRANLIRDLRAQGRRFMVAEGPLTESGAFQMAEALLRDLDVNP